MFLVEKGFLASPAKNLPWSQVPNVTDPMPNQSRRTEIEAHVRKSVPVAKGVLAGGSSTQV